MTIKKVIAVLGFTGLLTLATGCDKTKSYSELLNEEEHAVNWYLAQHEIETRLPEDSVFITGENAPFYKMNADGTIYMRVINAGDKSKRVKDGDRVYFTFMRRNIKYLSEGNDVEWVGNAEDLGQGVASTSFLFGNTVLESTLQYGTGIQEPLKWLGLYSQVELVIKSLDGFTSDMNQCMPYVYKVRYFPATY